MPRFPLPRDELRCFLAVFPDDGVRRRLPRRVTQRRYRAVVAADRPVYRHEPDGAVAVGLVRRFAPVQVRERDRHGARSLGRSHVVQKLAGQGAVSGCEIRGVGAEHEREVCVCRLIHRAGRERIEHELVGR